MTSCFTFCIIVSFLLRAKGAHMSRIPALRIPVNYKNHKQGVIFKFLDPFYNYFVIQLILILERMKWPNSIPFNFLTKVVLHKIIKQDSGQKVFSLANDIWEPNSCPVRIFGSQIYVWEKRFKLDGDYSRDLVFVSLVNIPNFSLLPYLEVS